MAELGSVDPDPARETVARTFRRRDDAELQADLVALIGRRTDLAAAQCAELFKAAVVRLQERHDTTGRVPSAAAIGAWVDAVVPPDPASVIAPVDGAVPYAPDPNAITLLTNPASDVIARGLLALAGRRPDLSDLQRLELFLAARLHLVIRKAGFIIPPTRQRIFEWIDLVATERTPPSIITKTGLVEAKPYAADDAAGQPGLLAAGDVEAPNFLAGETLSRALLQNVRATIDAGGSDTPAFEWSEELRAAMEANPPRSTDTYGLTRADRYRTPGWSDLAEMNYLAQTKERRQGGPPKSGRTLGSGWLIKDRAELLDMYRQMRQRAGRRPSQHEFADASGLGTRTVRRYLKRFGLRWPPD